MTTPYYQDDSVTLFHGDCLDILAQLPDASIDSVVTDPPYGLEFMGKDWDSFKTYAGGNPNMKPQGANIDGRGGPEWQPGSSHGYRQKNPRCRRCGKLMRGNGACKCPEPQVDTRTAESANVYQAWCEDWARELWRVLKPGGHLLAFGGTRTWHRLSCAVEDAGFEIRDSIAWLYGSGFPKSLDVSKAIDKAAGAEREVTGRDPNWRARVHSESTYDGGQQRPEFLTAPATDAAQQWQGWGTALKPAFEPIVVARKPIQGTVAVNVQAFGTGALNIDGCRVATSESLGRDTGSNGYILDGCSSVEHLRSLAEAGDKTPNGRNAAATYARYLNRPDRGNDGTAGRWPANVVLDGGQADELDRQSGVSTSTDRPRHNGDFKSVAKGYETAHTTYGHADTGGASRFFPVFRYEAKAPTTERPTYARDGSERSSYAPKRCTKCGNQAKNMTVTATCQCDEPDFQTDPAKIGVASHPTVKPLDLMRWLVRLVTPPHGLVLDPFAGSGTTAEACIHEHMRCITIEREADYLPLIVGRLSKPMMVGFDFEEEA